MVVGKNGVHRLLKGEGFFFGLAVGERLKRHVLILGASDRINSVTNSESIKQQRVF